jgi:hypothetical protein
MDVVRVIMATASELGVSDTRVDQLVEDLLTFDTLAGLETLDGTQGTFQVVFTGDLEDPEWTVIPDDFPSWVTSNWDHVR